MASESLFGELPERWVTTTLGEICQSGGGFIQTGPFGSQLHAADYVNQGIPSIMPQNIGENQVIEEDIARITEQDAKRLSKYRVQAGDIVYSRRGDVTRRALIRDENNGWLCGTGSLMVRLGKGIVDPRYVSYFLGDPSIREWIQRHAVGATMPNLNTSIMGAVPFIYPPLAEQRAIAGVLGALDDKIELNRRMNRMLESMAQAVFRQWFIEDPDRDWKIDTFGNVIKFLKGKKPNDTTDFTVDGYLPLILIEAFDSGVSTYANPQKMVVAQPNNPLMVMDGASSGRVEIGHHGVVGSTIAMIIKIGKIGDYYLYYSLKEKELEAREHLTGTSIPHMDKNWLMGQEICIPDGNKKTEFEKFAGTIRNKISANLKESHTLASLRDSLLPKLMKGEVRIQLGEGD